MSPEDSFIRAVCEAPDDDLPRLAFADWLDENGDPARAEFIRSSIRLHHIATSGLERYWEDAEYRQLAERLDHLASENWLRWTKPLFRIPRVEWPGRVYAAGGYERGFVNHVVFPTARSFADHAARVF